MDLNGCALGRRLPNALRAADTGLAHVVVVVPADIWVCRGKCMWPGVLQAALAAAEGITLPQCRATADAVG